MAAAAEIDKPVVERLDVDNYATWRTRMRFLLTMKGLWTAITDDAADADTDTKALALIGLYVKEHHLPTLEQCKTAREAWRQLESVYQAKSNARKLQLREELIQLKKGCDEPFQVRGAGQGHPGPAACGRPHRGRPRPHLLRHGRPALRLRHHRHRAGVR